MTYLFISDLHLSPNHPRLIRGFLDLLDHYAEQHTHLYILGDWFDAWIGDDDQAPFLAPIILALQQFNQRGNQIYFQAGNRDFALDEKFLKQFNATLLPEIYNFNIAHLHIRLEHGDALCTDDVSYQRFKRIIRHPILLKLLLNSPLSFRRKLAQGFRKKSQQSKSDKPKQIMDVNSQAVEHALNGVDLLIHGHTHRPAVHQHQHQVRGDDHSQYRIVLGDWREKTAEAQILEIDDQGQWHTIRWTFA